MTIEEVLTLLESIAKELETRAGHMAHEKDWSASDAYKLSAQRVRDEINELACV